MITAVSVPAASRGPLMEPRNRRTPAIACWRGVSGRLTLIYVEVTRVSTTAVAGERADLIETLDKHRGFVLHTVRGLTDEQAAQRTTASELCLGGIVKHLTAVEQNWFNFINHGASATGRWDDEEGMQTYLDGFRMLPGETLADLVAQYQEVARMTDELVAAIPDLDAGHALPEAPWHPAGTSWSARRVLLHVIAETAQHAGHADIIRESLDGAKTMG
jgi:uncharacterized damage-inducible protein DinB